MFLPCRRSYSRRRPSFPTRRSSDLLWCAPDTSDPFFRECERRHGAGLHAQGEGDLGARMRRAFESALARAARAILVGSDIPALSARYLRDADRALRRGDDAVIGPAEDGGYALIGLTRCDPELFRDIPWGGPEVLVQTRRRLAGLSWRSRDRKSTRLNSSH